MNFELMHPADQLVMIMDRIYNYGMTTTSGGNLSIKDEDGNIWITPSGIDKGNLTRKDINCVKPDGTVLGPYKPSSELPFHKHIYEIRPDLKGIVHAHPPTLVAFSLARKLPDINLVPNAKQVCGSVGIAKYDIPGSDGLGRNIAEKFAEGHNTVILENHGVVCGGKDLFSAFKAFETLDFCGRLEINAKKVGNPKSLTDAQITMESQLEQPKIDAFVPRIYSTEEKQGRREMCELVHRAYRQKLFTSTQGTFSMRLADGSFLVTPYEKDRMYIDPEDIVRINNGMCEAGKTPSRACLLISKIFATHPEINSVIIANPPAIMAFAVTDTDFDSRTIPESYIWLRNVQRVPYGSSALDEEGTAKKFCSSTPILLVDNECCIVAGESLLKAYDKLEVLEYSAKAVIAAKDVGETVQISDADIEDLKVAFNLN